METGTSPQGFWQSRSWSPYLVGAGIGVLSWFAFATGWLQPLVKALGDWGKVTPPQVTHTSPWWWIAGLTLAVIFALALLERSRRTWTEPKQGTA